MKNWYLSKDPTERIIILFIGVIIVLALFYLLVWSPISISHNRNLSQLENKRQLLSWMQSTSIEIKQLQNSSPAGRAQSGPLLSTVDSTIKSSELAQTMKRLEPQGNDKVQIWFENTGFDALILWLGTLANQHQIQVDSINIDRQPEAGKVNARLVLIKASS